MQSEPTNREKATGYQIATQLLEGDVRDDGDILIRCASCRKPLGNFIKSRPDVKIRNLITIDCPHCGDKSFTKEIYGMVHVGPTDQTDIVNVDTDVINNDDGYVTQKLHFITQVKGKK